MKVSNRIDHNPESCLADDFEPTVSTFVDAGGTKLHFVSQGIGRPVVLIHGNPGSYRDWAQVFGPLSDRYRAIAFDRPGHGLSDRPAHISSLTIEKQAELLRDGLNQIQVRQPILAGHSWGAALALVYALLFPGEVSGIALVAPAVYESSDGVSFLSKLPAWPIVGDLLNFLFTPLLAGWLIRTDLTKAFAPDEIPPNYLRHSLSEWTRPAKVKWYSVDDALLNNSLRQFAPRYAELEVPITVVTGDSDQIVPANENALRFHETVTASRLTILENTGHQIPYTRPYAVLDAIDRVAGVSKSAVA